MKEIGGVDMIKRIFIVIFAITLVVTGIAVGLVEVEGKTKYGKPIPDNIKVVKLKEILKNPKEYKNKEIVLEGNFAGICCATDFNYKEGIEMLEVYPKGFPVPKLDKGKPIRVYGIVKTIEKEHIEIYIEAKGVEVK